MTEPLNTPSANTRRCGCDCKNSSTFTSCEGTVQVPCCEYCPEAPCGYVVKWCCWLPCNGDTANGGIPRLMPLWRDCLFNGEACSYSNYDGRGVSPASQDIDSCASLWGGGGVPNNPETSEGHYETICPPIWEDTEGVLSKRTLPFDSCCMSPGGVGVTEPGGIGEGRCGWGDFYNMANGEWQSWITGVDGMTKWATLTITGETTARLVGAGPVSYEYRCDDFDCTGDNVFLLYLGDTPRDELCAALPNEVCVSVMADNFRTPCSSGQAVCDCCDPGYSSAPFILNAAGCGVNNNVVTMTRHVNDDAASDPCGFTAHDGDCGYFTGAAGVNAVGCTPPEKELYLTEWCTDGEWHLHGCCYDTSTMVATDLGTANASPNCSCPTGANPQFSLDLGACCCTPTVTCDCCETGFPATLYISTHVVSGGGCTFWEGKTITMTRSGTSDCTDGYVGYTWTGTLDDGCTDPVNFTLQVGGCVWFIVIDGGDTCTEPIASMSLGTADCTFASNSNTSNVDCDCPFCNHRNVLFTLSD